MGEVDKVTWKQLHKVISAKDISQSDFTGLQI